MDYEIEFQRLLEFAKQALSGVDIDKREVVAFAPVYVLSEVVADYENRLTKRALDGCSLSPDKKHSFDGDTVEICSYCESRRQ